MNMLNHRSILLITALMIISLEGISQTIDTLMLCRGNYFTEEQGKESLDQFASTYQDVQGWERRADRIRRGIMEGMQLTTLKFDTPLNPIIKNKREYDGYTVENIAFESLPGFFVTGNLYRPSKTLKSYAVVLS